MSILIPLIIFTNFVISVLPILFSNRDRAVYYFATSTLGASCWMLFVHIGWQVEDPLIFARLAFASCALGAGGFLLFALHYPNPLIQMTPFRFAVLHGIPAFFAVLGLTPVVLESIAANGVKANYNIGHPFYVLFCLVYFTGTFFFIFKRLKTDRGLDRVKLQFLVGSLLIAFVPIFITSVFLPLIGINDYNRIGPLSLTLFFAASAYTMIKHRFLDIQVVIKKSILYLTLVTCISLIFSAAVYLIGEVSRLALGTSTNVSAVIASALVVFIYPKLRTFIDDITDRIFFRKKVDFRQTISRFGQSFNTMLDLNAIIVSLVQILPQTMRVQHAAMFLANEGGKFELKRHFGPYSPPTTLLDAHHPLVHYFATTTTPLVKYDVSIDIKSLKKNEPAAPLYELFSALEALEVEVALPFFRESQLIGILIMGPKQSDEIYTVDDLTLLETVAQHASTAIQNAHHYAGLQQNISELSRLNEYAKNINSTFDTNRIYSEIVNVLTDLFHFDQVLLMSVNQETDLLLPVFTPTRSLSRLYQYRFPIDKSFLEDKIRDGVTLTHSDLQQDQNIEVQQFYKALSALAPEKAFLFIPFSSGREVVGAAIGFAGDIHDQLSAEKILLGTIAQEAAAALNNSKLYYKVVEMKNYNEEVLESVLSGVVTLDENLRILSFNKRAEELTGMSAAEVTGKPVSVLYDVTGEFNLFEKSLMNGCRFESEAVVEVGGKDLHIAIATDILETSTTKQVGVIGVISDLTTIYELQGQIAQADRLSSLGTMAAGIAHEIKNPLVAIKAFTQMMPKHWEEDHFRTKFVEIVGPQIERINGLSQALLRLGKPQKLTLADVRIHEVVAEVLILLEGERKSHNAEVKTELDKTDLIVLADRNQMTQVILNICLNAIQALPEQGGQLTLTTRLNDSGYVHLSIQDTGCGIPKKDLERLFDPFYTTKQSGNGLGLSIVYKIIEEHHGKITVESKEGKGTTFHLYLPTEGADPEKLLATEHLLLVESDR